MIVLNRITDFAITTAKPRTAISVQKESPVAKPRTLQRPAFGPYRSVFFTTSIVSAPGITTIMAAIDMYDSRLSIRCLPPILFLYSDYSSNHL
ncbi:hypothetical protein CHCC14557_3734 [Bacillus licheniformis]|nr:hypothetical protein CHCC14557_3734 [Bacillus licheniformis]